MLTDFLTETLIKGRAEADVTIIAGPTASGKSTLALKLAQALDGEIINADSVQLYKDLPLLTAAPSQQDKELCPHHLYGILEAHQTSSAAWWLSKAVESCQAIGQRGKHPILVGGTGLYLQAFEKGLSVIPFIDPTIRTVLQNRLQEEGLPVLYHLLQQLDPEGAAVLSSHDTQRILRALEVIQGTQNSLRFWQKQPVVPPTSFRIRKILLSPLRDVLKALITQRWCLMKDKGVIKEVKAWLDTKNHLSLNSTLGKAIGLKEIEEFLQGEHNGSWLDEAVIRATCRYTKRQQTWFRHQLAYDIIITNLSDIS